MSQQNMNTPTGGSAPFSVTTNFDNVQRNFSELFANQVIITGFPGADLGAKFNAAIAAAGKSHVKFVLPIGSYTLSTSVDLTDARNVIVDLRGAHIHVVGDIIGLDCTDMEDTDVHWGYVTGDGTSKPKAFILHADSIGGGANSLGWSQSVSERNRFFGGNIAGCWTLAPLIHQGREGSVFTGYYQNNNSQGYAFAVTRSSFIIIGSTKVVVTSPHKGAITGGGSPTKFILRDGCLFSRTAKGDGLLYLQGACGNSQLNHIEFRSLGEPCVVLPDEVDYFLLNDIAARPGHELGDLAFNFIQCIANDPTSPTSYGMPRDWVVNGTLQLAQGAGIPGYAFYGHASGGGASNLTINATSNSNTSGVNPNSRTLTNLDLKNVSFGGGMIDGDGKTYLVDKIDGHFRFSANNISCIGRTPFATSIVSGSQNNFRSSSSFSSGALKNFQCTNSAYTAIQLEGSGLIAENIYVVSALNDGWDIRGSYNKLINCGVGACGSTRDAIKFSATAAFNVVIGGRYVGDFEFAGSNNIVIGAIVVGDVDFISGSSGNRLIGCSVSGTITNNGTDNTY